MSYVTGEIIKELREKKKLTQKQLADILMVSDKTVSKWETNRGLPDIGVIESLASALGVSLAELLVGEISVNQNRSANIKKSVFYVCPICGNIITSTGKGSYSCCGVKLPALEIEEDINNHIINQEIIDNEIYVSIDHPMTKEHYISFICYVSSNAAHMVKQYPESSAEARFARRGHGIIYAYCNKHGLFKLNI